VVVPCRNEIKAIGPFLDSLLRQDLEDIQAEIIIADGMSDDGTREVLEAFCEKHHQVKVIDNRDRIVSTALNAAIRVAKGEIIIRMDVHARYASNYVRSCVDVLERTEADNVGGPAIAKGDGYIGRVVAAAFQSVFSVGGARGHQPDYEGPVDTVCFGCWRTDVFGKIGLFDEALIRNQDDELNFRLVREGGVVWQSPEIVSWYQPRSSLSAFFRQQFQYGFWKVAVIQKHRLPASWRHLVPGTFVLANIALLIDAVIRLLRGPGLSSWLLVAGASMDFTYVCASLLASLRAAKQAGWRLLPLLPLAFGIYHVAWGSGFLVGLFYFSTRPRGMLPRQNVFSEITR
jgi:succinoglycan biosynthesis protein ExoA